MDPVCPAFPGKCLFLDTCSPVILGNALITVVSTTDQEEVASDLVGDTEDTFNDLTSGMTVQVTVTARNATGESQPSDPVSIVVP